MKKDCPPFSLFLVYLIIFVSLTSPDQYELTDMPGSQAIFLLLIKYILSMQCSSAVVSVLLPLINYP